MKFSKRSKWVKLGTAAVTILLMLACGLFSNPDPEPDLESPPSSTPTPTSGGLIEVAPPSDPSRCDGLSGALEIQILVGPAEAVGMEPVAVGELPFSVASEDGAYLIQGGGGVSYQQTMTEVWGTYSVSLNMAGTLQGECSGEPGSEILDVTVEMSGEQMVEVRAEGFSGDYPWSGSHTMELSFPLEEGATAEGEGWAFVLHLSK